MSEDLYYYRERVQQLEAELAQANKTIDKLNKRLNDIKRAVASRNFSTNESVLSTIAWLSYDWKD